MWLYYFRTWTINILITDLAFTGISFAFLSTVLRGWCITVAFSRLFSFFTSLTASTPYTPLPPISVHCQWIKLCILSEMFSGCIWRRDRKPLFVIKTWEWSNLAENTPYLGMGHCHCKLDPRLSLLRISFHHTVEQGHRTFVSLIAFPVYTSSCRRSMHSILPNYRQLKK